MANYFAGKSLENWQEKPGESKTNKQKKSGICWKSFPRMC